MKKLLADWFAQNKRDLPWRNTQDPYLIWLSEVILQQTQVVQGLSYYHHFSSTYPSIADLARASEDEVMKLWEGLGYYSRARNLHKTAKIVAENYGGIFPDRYEDIRALPGIGDYTAAAIASFAFDLCHPVLDGNVARVISRMFGMIMPIDTHAGRAELLRILNKQFDKQHPAEFNQAIMEFGAICCKPRQPLCAECPFQSDCYAFRHKTVEFLPMKKNKIVVKPRRLNYLICIEEGCIWIKKRTKSDIWRHLYDFPEADDKHLKKLRKSQLLEVSEHQLSHQRLTISFWKTDSLPEKLQISAQKIPVAEFFSLATPKPINNFAVRNQLIAKPVEKKRPNVKKF